MAAQTKGENQNINVKQRMQGVLKQILMVYTKKAQTQQT